ncbi:30S ribosomal protein S12 methylthiotransferase RimO [Candidatus Bipolaricaulota bacterium]|nr:30S ribosomal protein S12 methylthiotransferase RimO [Candidatus Bipolaricaulota bacterium]
MSDDAARNGPRVHLASLGCAKNLIDSERILARFAAAGAIVGAPPEEAEIIIVNTCGFIEPAKRESIDTILDYARYKEEGNCQRLIVMGCLAQRYSEELRQGLPEVDGVFGLNQDEEILAACGFTRTCDSGRFLLTPSHTAYLRISDGCDNRCTYCTIPLIRGSYHGRPAGEIISEAEELVERGVREINVIAQDTTVYGAEAPGGMRIHDLLARLAKIPDLHWLRLLYTHPAHFPDGMIDAYAQIPKLCPYVDLPLQHLNDDILRRMARGVTRDESLRLIERLRARVPGIAIRTTFIAGFPGETDEQFNELLQYVRQLEFDHLGVFPYSQEEDTPAALMPGQVPEEVKEERVAELMLAQQEIVFARNASLVGSRMEVVIDAPGDKDGVWLARSRTQAPDVDSITFVEGKGLSVGEFIEVEVTGADGYDLIARPV